MATKKSRKKPAKKKRLTARQRRIDERISFFSTHAAIAQEVADYDARRPRRWEN